MARTNMAMLFTNDMATAITASMTKGKAEFPKLWVTNIKYKQKQFIN